jgi:hypothetical protein
MMAPWPLKIWTTASAISGPDAIAHHDGVFIMRVENSLRQCASKPFALHKFSKKIRVPPRGEAGSNEPYLEPLHLDAALDPSID